MNPEDFLRAASVIALPLISAITLHEWAHGWVASIRGDHSAKMLGRLSLNPIKHIDPIGTILVPLTLIVTGTGFIFGWAKPVPVNQSALKNPRFDMALVAIAGPLANIIMAILWGMIIKFSPNITSEALLWLKLTSASGVSFNIFLAVLNMLPIPPLDGGRIASALIPRKLAFYYDKLEPYGLFILIALMLSGILSTVISPIYFSVTEFLNHLLQF